ncbi:MAG: cupredoxin domain-containing protein [archaeon]|nr:cupredoxin domain-containing protein [archaeon]
MDIIKCEACNREFINKEALATHNYDKHDIPLTNSSKNEESKNSGISKKTIFIILGVLAIIILGYLFMEKSLTGNTTSGEIQKITLSYKNYNYYPNTITVEADKPVEITLDDSIRGCFRSFTIRDLGVNSYSQNPSEKIKFNPTKKGSFIFACSMHMGTGTIIVK